jgi:two-component system, NarL family, response regulator YdfI
VTRVFVVADREESATDLAALVAEDERLEVVGAAALDSVSRSSVDVSGAEVLLLSRVPPSRFQTFGLPLVLLSDDRFESWDFQDSVRARLPVHTTPPEAFAALIAAAQGLTVLTPSQAEAILTAKPRAQTAPLIEALTPREMEVLRAMADGLQNKEIAQQLGISEHTAKFHVASILGKLDATTRAEAVAIGMRRGLIPI